MDGPSAPIPDENVPGERTKTPRVRTFSKYPLPSNRNPFGVHFEVLKRFVTLTRNGSEGLPASKVEGSGVPVQAASMNVRFLRSINLLTITDRGMYVPTSEAIRFIMARSVGDDRARPILASILSTSWFAELAQRLFATQPIMSEDQFLGELALAAETDKAKEEPALRVLVEYLIYAGIVARDERGLSLASTTPLPKAAMPEAAPTLDFAAPVNPLAPEVSLPVAGGTAPEAPGWHVLTTEDFHVRIRSDPDVMEDLLAHLHALQRKIQRVRARSVQAPPVAPPNPEASPGAGGSG